MIFLDNNSTTPLDPRVLENMLPWMRDNFANASSSGHRMALEADAIVEISRRNISAVLNCHPSEIYFTSGATESINTILRGFGYQNVSNKIRYISAQMEHPATLETLQFLSKYHNSHVEFIPCDSEGLYQFEQIKPDDDFSGSIVSICWVNNEIGVIQDLDEISAICKGQGMLLHVDATQGLGKLPLDLEKAPIDALSASAHKFYGPKGVGLLYIRNSVKKLFAPLLTGGGQNNGFRAGTLNVPGIVGLSTALTIMRDSSESEGHRIAAMREKLLTNISKTHDSLYINGSQKKRIYNNLNFRIEGYESSFWLKHLKNVCISTSSACTAGKRSHVLQALGLTGKQIDESLRIGIGRFNTDEEIERVIRNFTTLLNDEKI